VVTALAAAPNDLADFRPDRILIKPKPNGAPRDLGRFHTRQGVRVIREFPRMEGIQVLQLPPGAQVPAMVDRYQRSGLVEFAEPDFRLRPGATPNDPFFSNGSLWHLNNYGQSGGTTDADIDAPEAWDALNNASNTIVAVVDTGIRYTHEDLAANMWVNPGEIPGNGIDDDGDGFVDDVHGINTAANNGDPIDLVGHGTHVAGYIGGVGNNGLGVAGVAWRVRLMACRFYDDAGLGYVSDAVQGIAFARTKGAQVINASFVSTAYSSTFYSAINNCRTAGIIFVAAAGNDANNNNATPYYPAGYDLDNVVVVAATTRNDDLASFSNYGASSVDLAAPGQDLTSTFNSADNAYAQNSGTSFSAPIVAGAFALMRARYPAANHRQLIDQVLSTTDPLPTLAGKCVTGGRLNLARALGPAVIANYTSSPLAGAVPLTVKFTNTSFGAINSLLWDFGDGSTSGEQNPSHTYNAPGNFIASLKATGAGGATGMTSRSIVAVLNYQMTNATFAWIDPGATPPLNLTGDSVSSPLSLPFAFKFYGQSYSTLYVSANGLLGFENQSLSSAVNTDLPAAAAPNNIICPFWDDLNPASTSVRFGTVGTAPNRKTVVSWVAAQGVGGPPASFTFQVVLEEASNAISFQYLDVQPGSRNNSAAGKSATVGIEHASGLVATRYSYNGSTLRANNQAIRLIPSPGTVTGNLLPTVEITAPLNGTVLTAPASFTVTAAAADSDGAVANVEFQRNGSSLGMDTTSPYSVSVNGLAAGTHTLAAIATDNAGAKATNTISIVVNAPPTVSITSPTAGQTFAAPASIAIEASASDSDGTIARVEFFNGAIRLGEDTISPYHFNWNTLAAGSYSVTARATDDRGASNDSGAIVFEVTNSPPKAVVLVNLTLDGATPTFLFLTETGRSYTVESASILNATNWQTLTNLTGTGTNATITDPAATTSQRFYRVRAE
jgi:PKD repeat protein